MIAIAEISGADSIAAALRFAEEHPGCRLVPTYVATGTEFGDFSAIEGNLAFLRDELPTRGGELHIDLVRSEDPALWRALSGRPAGALAELFGCWLPCIGCHLYLHLMRIPLAISLGAPVISGERERHDERTKTNQLPEVLDGFVEVLSSAGVDLAMPIRTMASGDEVQRVLGERWPGGSPQLECVLKGNERTLDGTASALPDRFVEDYVVPAGRALAAELVRGTRDYDGAVERVIEAAASRRAQ